MIRIACLWLHPVRGAARVADGPSPARLALLLASTVGVCRRAGAGRSARAPAGEAPPAPPSGDNAGPAPPATAPTTASPSLGPYGYGNPQSPNGTIGGGNATESSAHPVTGDQEDSFDLGRSAAASGGSTTARGSANGPVFVGPSQRSPARRSPTRTWCGAATRSGASATSTSRTRTSGRASGRTTRRSRTRTGSTPATRSVSGKAGDSAAAAARRPSRRRRRQSLGGQGDRLVDRRRKVPSGTVFLRDQGWIHDDSDADLGRPDRVVAGQDVPVRPRRGLPDAAARPRRAARPGAHGLPAAQDRGRRRDRADPRDRAGRPVHAAGSHRRGRGSSSRSTSSSAARPSARSSDASQVVPPRRNDADVQAHVLASLHPNDLFGQNQVVFIDKGEAAGLKPGNRLFVVRRGDAWRRRLVTPGAGYRVSADDERPMPPMESTPGARHEEEKYPDEVVGRAPRAGREEGHGRVPRDAVAARDRGRRPRRGAQGLLAVKRLGAVRSALQLASLVVVAGSLLAFGGKRDARAPAGDGPRPAIPSGSDVLTLSAADGGLPGERGPERVGRGRRTRRALRRRR